MVSMKNPLNTNRFVVYTLVIGTTRPGDALNNAVV
jgi:hypothetical protein